jgi:potassium/hydrogen antiporter
VGAGDAWDMTVGAEHFVAVAVVEAQEEGFGCACGRWCVEEDRLPVEGLYPLTVIAFGALAYGLAATIGASGFVAVYVTGVLVGALLPRQRRAILGFHEAVANAAEIGLFLLLVFPSQLPAVAVASLLVAAVLTFVARPVTVWLCTLGQPLNWRERTVPRSPGSRGAVPTVLATFPLIAGVAEADLIFDALFFVVLVSVLVQGIALLPIRPFEGAGTRRPEDDVTLDGPHQHLPVLRGA